MPTLWWYILTPKHLGKYLFHWNDLRISASCSTTCRQKINTARSI